MDPLTQYSEGMNRRMTQLLQDYARHFESMKTMAEREQEIVLFNIFANERGMDTGTNEVYQNEMPVMF